MLALLFSFGCSREGIISGKLISPQGPVQNAKVSLTVYEDESCANLAKRGSLSKEEESRLSTCRKEKSAEVSSDSEGRYKFSNVAPGWYALVIERDLSGQIEPGYGFQIDQEKQGDFSVNYLFVKDSNGKKVSSATASTEPFLFSGNEDLKKNLEYKKH